MSKTKPVQLPLDQRLDAELWMAERIADHCNWKLPDMFGGVLTPEQRREVLRKAILENALSQVFLGKRNGKGETYETFFSRIYGQKLT